MKKIDDYIQNNPERADQLTALRTLLTDSELTETVKWGMPCYTLQGKNLIGLAAFKKWTALWFYQGALLSDKAEKLINAQPGKTKMMRHWRFKDLREILENTQEIKNYIRETIDIRKETDI